MIRRASISSAVGSRTRGAESFGHFRPSKGLRDRSPHSSRANVRAELICTTSRRTDPVVISCSRRSRQSAKSPSDPQGNAAKPVAPDTLQPDDLRPGAFLLRRHLTSVPVQQIVERHARIDLIGMIELILDARRLSLRFRFGIADFRLSLARAVDLVAILAGVGLLDRGHRGERPGENLGNTMAKQRRK